MVENPLEDHELGQWDTIDAPIGPIPGTLMKQQIISPPYGKNALTRYTCRGSFDYGSIIEAEIDTGRTHQIRVHMASIGHPLVGDRLYGKDTENTTEARRALLHAWKVTFRQPFGSEIINVSAPLPDDMMDYMKLICKGDRAK